MARAFQRSIRRKGKSLLYLVDGSKLELYSIYIFGDRETEGWDGHFARSWELIGLGHPLDAEPKSLQKANSEK